MMKKKINKFSSFLLELKKDLLATDKQWNTWLKKNKSFANRERIIIGAILTQNTSWQNVEKALSNLRKNKLLNLKKIGNLTTREFIDLKKQIRPAGFFNAKANYLRNVANFFQQNGGVKRVIKTNDDRQLRQALLKIKGIGRETADSILNYALDKNFFVIDKYTKRFCLQKKITKITDYEKLRALFEKNLPRDFRAYQKFHALIVQEEKHN